MHALWDQILGEDFALRTVRRRYAEIVTSDELRAVGEQALGIPGGLDPQVWLTNLIDITRPPIDVWFFRRANNHVSVSPFQALQRMGGT